MSFLVHHIRQMTLPNVVHLLSIVPSRNSFDACVLLIHLMLPLSILLRHVLRAHHQLLYLFYRVLIDLVQILQTQPDLLSILPGLQVVDQMIQWGLLVVLRRSLILLLILYIYITLC